MKKLYNILFPIWFLYFLPSYNQLIIIPLNFGIDSLALYIISKIRKFNFKAIYKKTIIKIWLFGFLSDLISSLILLSLMYLLSYLGVNINVSFFPGSTLYALPGVIIAGLLIYFFNLKFSFKKTDLTKEEIKHISKWLTIITSPYLMLIPLYW